MTRSIDAVDRALTRFRIASLTAHIERHVPKPTIDDARPDPHALPGDPIRLRGIPIVGRGVAGATPGSTPHNMA